MYKFLDSNAVIEIKGCKRSELAAEIRAGLFPHPMRYDNKLVWRVLEMAAVLEAKMAGLSTKETSALVSRLVESRYKLISVVNLPSPPRNNRALSKAARDFLSDHPVERELALSILFGPGSIFHSNNKQSCA